jgi:hypothetical protein
MERYALWSYVMDYTTVGTMWSSSTPSSGGSKDA